MSGPRPRLLLAVSHPMTARLLLRGQLAHLAAAGFEVAVATAPGPELDAVRTAEGVRTFAVPFRREIAPLADLRVAAAFSRVLTHFRPHLVNAGTPKAGLVGMATSRRRRVPVRIYTVRGLRLETASGVRRALFRLAERVAAGSAHRVVCVSESLRRRVVELELAPAEKTVVLGAGSSNGVDVERFHPRRRSAPESEALRREVGIPGEAPVVGFVGRMTRDKGIGDLLAGFEEGILPRVPEARMLLVGDFEAGDPVPYTVRRQLEGHPRVVVTGFVPDAAPWYGAIDVLAFPSYREGFPNAPLEAAASGVPTAGYAATGTVDAVVDGATGTLVPVGLVGELVAAVVRYLEDPELRRRHGTAGRERAVERFRQEVVWEGWVGEYRRLLEESGTAARIESPPDRKPDASR